MNMKTIYDVQQLLRKFGTFIYTGDRIGDLELMELEINELYQLKFIQIEEFQVAKLLLRKAKRQLIENKGASFFWGKK